MWDRLCDCRLDSWVNALPHPGCWHLYGFSPVCVLYNGGRSKISVFLYVYSLCLSMFHSAIETSISKKSSRRNECCRTERFKDLDSASRRVRTLKFETDLEGTWSLRNGPLCDTAFHREDTHWWDALQVPASSMWQGIASVTRCPAKYSTVNIKSQFFLFTLFERSGRIAQLYADTFFTHLEDIIWKKFHNGKFWTEF